MTPLPGSTALSVGAEITRSSRITARLRIACRSGLFRSVIRANCCLPLPPRLNPIAGLKYLSCVALAVSVTSPPIFTWSSGETRVSTKYSNRFGQTFLAASASVRIAW